MRGRWHERGSKNPGGGAGKDSASRSRVRKLNIAGLAMPAVFVGCIGGWAATARSPAR